MSAPTMSPPTSASPTKPTRTTGAPWFPAVVAGLFATGLGLRLWLILVNRPTCTDSRNPTGRCFQIGADASYHFVQAELIAKGHFWKYFGATVDAPYVDSAGDPPAYAGLLGLLWKLGFDSARDLRIASAIVGASGIILVALLVRRLAGPRAGVIAAGFGAIHPMWWINDGMLLSESLYIPAVLAIMLAGYHLWDHRTAGSAAWLGAAIGAASLVRVEAIFLFGFLVIPLVWALRPHWRRMVTLAATSGAVGAAVVSPWLVYNAVRFEGPVTMTSVGGTVLMAASCDRAWSGNQLGYWADCYDDRDLLDDYAAAFPDADVHKPDEGLLDEWNRDQATTYITDHLGRFPVVAAARIGRTFSFYRVSQTRHLDATIEYRGQGATKAGLVGYYVLVPLTVIGLVALKRRGLPISPLLAMWPTVALAVAVAMGVIRYRLPVDVAMVAAGAVGADALLRRVWPA